MNSCYFIGHGNADDSVLVELMSQIERHIVECNVEVFYVGHYGRFDQLATTAVKQVKKQYPGVKLFLVLPYHPAERPVELTPGFDGSFYPPGMETVPRPYAIVRANRYMVSWCTHLIAHTGNSVGNSRKLPEYARKKPISITVI